MWGTEALRASLSAVEKARQNDTGEKKGRSEAALGNLNAYRIIVCDGAIARD
jgi:hypothetical protein